MLHHALAITGLSPSADVYLSVTVTCPARRNVRRRAARRLGSAATTGAAPGASSPIEIHCGCIVSIEGFRSPTRDGKLFLTKRARRLNSGRLHSQKYGFPTSARLRASRTSGETSPARDVSDVPGIRGHYPCWTSGTYSTADLESATSPRSRMCAILSLVSYVPCL